MNICTTDDDYTREHMRWVVELSNGLTVYQDDGRPGCYPESAWIRLKKYLSETEESIENMYLQFRSHIESPLPKHADGYFFSHCVAGVSFSHETIRFYLVGALQNNKLIVQKWVVPEILLCETEERDIDKAGDCLIIRKNNENKRTKRLLVKKKS